MEQSTIFCKLIHLAEKNNIRVSFAPLPISRGRYKALAPDDGRIAVRQNLPTIEEYNYEIAHEMAHAYLHFDKGCILEGMIDDKLHKQYEEQANRAAKMLLDALSQE